MVSRFCQRRSFWLSLPANTDLPSGEMATEVMASLEPVKVRYGILKLPMVKSDF
jgi:hypothetical protein